MTRFADRREAGRLLAPLVADRRLDAPVVVGLPRGGVPVAAAVARALPAPLDVLVVRKLGVPGHEELAMGAIASGGVRILNRSVIEQLRITEGEIEAAAAEEEKELRRRELAYRDGRSPQDPAERVVILVDDGLATGASMRAAVLALRRKAPARIVVAVPVGARDTCREIRMEVDECVCASTPEPFRAVGCWYEDFPQTEDREVQELLRGSA
jgi:predicted phosphoribosyltransferase